MPRRPRAKTLLEAVPLLAGGRKPKAPKKTPKPKPGARPVNVKGVNGGLRDPPGGRPPHVPTEAARNLAKICAALNKTIGATAELMGISRMVFDKYYRADYACGKANVDVAVAGKLVSAATSPNHTGATIEAAKFWAKTQMGWKEGSVLEVNGALTVTEADPLEFIEGRLAGIAARLEPPGDPQRSH